MYLLLSRQTNFRFEKLFKRLAVGHCWPKQRFSRTSAAYAVWGKKLTLLSLSCLRYFLRTITSVLGQFCNTRQTRKQSVLFKKVLVMISKSLWYVIHQNIHLDVAWCLLIWYHGNLVLSSQGTSYDLLGKEVPHWWAI